ncbi:MAG TPA: GGDEF domain-containing protein [Tepidiformaceae bacterium]
MKRTRGQKHTPQPTSTAYVVDPALVRNRRSVYGITAGIGALSLATIPFVPVVGAGLTLSAVALGGLIRRADTLAERDRQAAIEASIHEQAESFFIDRFTDLPNRQHLLDQLAREIARAGRYSYDLTLAMVELNRVPELQATWGHSIADRAVLHVANTLKRITRTSDFVARIDAERFAVVLLKCSVDQAAVFGDRVALAVANRPLKRDESLKVPVYINVEVKALQFDRERFRGPLEFLSAAGGEAVPIRDRFNGRGAGDARSLRQQLVVDYYPDGKIEDFADAYRAHRDKERAS